MAKDDFDEPEDGGITRRRLIQVGVGAGVGAGAVAAIVIASGGDDKDPASAGRPRRSPSVGASSRYPLRIPTTRTGSTPSFRSTPTTS